MEKEFLPYELSWELEKIGFDSKGLDFHLGCFAYYGNEGSNLKGKLIPNNVMRKHHKFNYSEFIIAPLWQQVFDWFRDNHQLSGEIYKQFPHANECIDWCYAIPLSYDRGHDMEGFKTYEEARLECVKKLIEIVKIDQ